MHADNHQSSDLGSSGIGGQAVHSKAMSPEFQISFDREDLHSDPRQREVLRQIAMNIGRQAPDFLCQGSSLIGTASGCDRGQNLVDSGRTLRRVSDGFLRPF
jgi:hypothetical protein